MKIKSGETLSEKLDRKVREIKKQKTSIEDLITTQYDEAKTTIGVRLTMKKESDIRFNFFFTGLHDCYDCSLSLKSADIEQQVQFTISEEMYATLLNIPRNIVLKELSTTLINWTKLLVDHELKKEEMKDE